MCAAVFEPGQLVQILRSGLFVLNTKILEENMSKQIKIDDNFLTKIVYKFEKSKSKTNRKIAKQIDALLNFYYYHDEDQENRRAQNYMQFCEKFKEEMLAKFNFFLIEYDLKRNSEIFQKKKIEEIKNSMKVIE